MWPGGEESKSRPAFQNLNKKILDFLTFSARSKYKRFVCLRNALISCVFFCVLQHRTHCMTLDSLQKALKAEALGIGIFEFYRPRSIHRHDVLLFQFAVLETLSDWHSANSGDRSNKSGDFQDQGEELSSGYRGGVKIDLDFTFIAQCEIPMFPFVIFFYGILHPDSHADVESISKFLTLFVCIPLLLAAMWKIPCVASSGRLKGVTAEFWWLLVTKKQSKFLSKASMLTSDDSGHHPKMCLGLEWSVSQQSISGRCGMFRKNLFEIFVNK